MAKKNAINVALVKAADVSRKWIAEAAYYGWEKRMRYALSGNEMNDWLAAEKELHNDLPTS